MWITDKHKQSALGCQKGTNKFQPGESGGNIMEKWLWVACKLSQLLSLTATSLPMVKATASAVHIPVPQGTPPDSRQCSEFPQLWSCVSSSNPEALTKIPLQVFPLLDAYVPAFSFGVSLNTHFRTCTSVPLPLSWKHIPHCQKL